MNFFKKNEKIENIINRIKLVVKKISEQVNQIKEEKRKIVFMVGIAALFMIILTIGTISYILSSNKPLSPESTQIISASPVNTLEETTIPIETTNSITNTPKPTSTVEPTNTIAPTPVPEEEIETWAQLIIKVNRKERTLDVLEGINESNLDECVAHMPGSSLPGEAGVCIFMGHRDTDFKILKKATIGDRITVIYNGKSYIYEIDKIEILSNQSQIDYEIRNTPSIALVTCYPFNYVGSAPQQCVMYASLIS